MDYQPHHSKVLEAAHQSGKETAIISIGGNSYTVWVTELTQVNDKTRKPRDIRRVTAGTWSEPRMLSPLSSGVLQSEMVLNVRALSQDNINLFEEKLLKILSDSMDKMEVSLDNYYYEYTASFLSTPTLACRSPPPPPPAQFCTLLTSLWSYTMQFFSH